MGSNAFVLLFHMALSSFQSLFINLLVLRVQGCSLLLHLFLSLLLVVHYSFVPLFHPSHVPDLQFLVLIFFSSFHLKGSVVYVLAPCELIFLIFSFPSVGLLMVFFFLFLFLSHYLEPDFLYLISAEISVVFFNLLKPESLSQVHFLGVVFSLSLFSLLFCTPFLTPLVLLGPCIGFISFSM